MEILKTVCSIVERAILCVSTILDVLFHFLKENLLFFILFIMVLFCPKEFGSSIRNWIYLLIMIIAFAKLSENDDKVLKDRIKKCYKKIREEEKNKP